MEQVLQKLNQGPKQIKIAIVVEDKSIQNLILGSILMETDKVEAYQFINSSDAINQLWLNPKTISKNIDALFIDISLSDSTSDVHLLKYCQNIQDKIPIVLMSSQFNDAHIDLISQFTTTPILLPKPFRADELIQLTQWIFKLNLRESL